LKRPEIISGRPQTVSGRPQIVSGRPQAASGRLQIVSGQPGTDRGVTASGAFKTLLFKKEINNK
jgi:hypothetical protein